MPACVRVIGIRYASISVVDRLPGEDDLPSSTNGTVLRVYRHSLRAVLRVYDCRVDFEDIGEESFRNHLLGRPAGVHRPSVSVTTLSAYHTACPIP